MEAIVNKTDFKITSHKRVTERDENGLAIAWITDEYLQIQVKFPTIDRRKLFTVTVLLPTTKVVMEDAIKVAGQQLEIAATEKLALEQLASSYMELLAGAVTEQVTLNL